jgi:hypothetical protein
MKRKAMWTAVALVLLATLAAAQMQEQYLDVYTVQVKPEKRADFDALTKKMVAANRQNQGDIWLTMEAVYGPGDRVTFISTRQGYGDAEKASDTFYGAIQKAYGKPGTDKLFQDYSQCVTSSRSEFRRRRWDLSSNAPTDSAGLAKLLGESRWLRTVVVHVRPGQVDGFEALEKDLKVAREKASPPITTLISQAVAGQEGIVYYVTTPQTSLAGFETMPSMQKLLGDDGYAKYLKVNIDAVANTETVINHFLPELSNPPEAVVAAAPDYWRPKAVVAKTSTKRSAVVNAAGTTKMEDKSQQH